jgi:hypothetical protein
MLTYKIGEIKIQKVNQTFLPACSVLAFEYAGHSFLLQELTTNTTTKAAISKKAIFFIPNTILIPYKNSLFILKTNFMQK